MWNNLNNSRYAKIHKRTHILVLGLQMLRIAENLSYYALAYESGYNDSMLRLWSTKQRKLKTTKKAWKKISYPEPTIKQLEAHYKPFGFKLGIRKIGTTCRIHKNILEAFDMSKIKEDEEGQIFIRGKIHLKEAINEKLKKKELLEEVKKEIDIRLLPNTNTNNDLATYIGIEGEILNNSISKKGRKGPRI